MARCITALLYLELICLILSSLDLIQFTIAQNKTVGTELKLVSVSTYGEYKVYNITSCKNTTHAQYNVLKGIDAYNCINMYEGRSCQGTFIRWQPYEFTSTRMEETAAHSWSEDEEMLTYDLRVGSLGPCFDRCDARHWDSLDLTGKFEVVLYDEQDFKGIEARISISDSECVPIPPEIDGVMSIKIIQNHNSCIELHSSLDCTSDGYTILRPGYPNLNNLYYHGMHESYKVAAHSVKAVSLCGKFCNVTRIAISPNASVSVDKDPFVYIENEDYDVSVTWGSRHYSGGVASFNITGCVSLRPAMYQRLHRLRSNKGKCMNIYRKSNCRGRVVRWVPLFETLYELQYTHWIGDIKAGVVRAQVKSVGPCTDKCDPKYWERSNGRDAVEITFFSGFEFMGSKTVLKVKPDECLLIPPSVSIRSIKLEGNDSCIELHRAPHCGDTSYALIRPDYPNLGYLYHHGQHDETKTSVTSSRAVSLCGGFCEKRKQMKAMNDPPEENPGTGVVTIFDYVGYYGNSAHNNLSHGCLTFEGDGLSGVGSLWTYGQCVVVYGTRGCKEENVFTEIIQIPGKPVEYYLEKLTAQTFPHVVRSMRLCNETEIAGEINSKQEAESSDPIRCKDTDLQVNSDICTGGIPTHLYWLVLLIIMLNTAISTTFGAFAYSKYEARKMRKNSNRFTVLYNSEQTEVTNN